MRYSFLDGLRGWASVMVLLHHVLFYFVDQQEVLYPYPLIRLASAGRLWVGVFFVLSGFVLSIEYIRTRNQTLLYKMAARRYVRLAIPVSVATLLAYILLVLGMMHHQEMATQLGNTWLTAFFAFPPALGDLIIFPFYDVFFDYDPAHSYNPNFWTMPVEFLGSMIIFLLLLTTGNARVRWIGYAIVVAACVFFRSALFGMSMGLILAELYAMCRKRLAWLWWGVFIMMAVAALLIRPHENSPLLFDSVAVAIVLSVLLTPLLQKILSLPLSQFLGRISFPLYLVHMPVLCSLGASAYLQLHRMSGWSEEWILHGTALITIAGSILAAVAFVPVERFAICASHKAAEYLLKK